MTLLSKRGAEAFGAFRWAFGGCRTVGSTAVGNGLKGASFPSPRAPRPRALALDLPVGATLPSAVAEPHRAASEA